MKFLAGVVVLAGLVVAESAESAASMCPTVTKEMIPRECSRRCANANCEYVSTVQNPCGCPEEVPTATLIHPCGADCPNNGCGVSIRIQDLPCPVETSRTRQRPPPTPEYPSPVPSTRPAPGGPPVVTTGITTVGPPRTTACPTVTRTTMPADCPPLRCPVPNCEFQDVVRIPCGCAGPKTALFVTGCPSECPEGCLTRVRTSTDNCPR